MEEGER